MKDLDWSNLSFGYRQTDYNVRCYYRDGKWGEIEVCSDEYLKLHMAATCLHYGQEAFEGLKAYRCPDGKVSVFRMDENAKRLQSTCRGILMPEVPTEMFEEMVKKVVRLNQEWIPTYESGATLYIRPLLIGTSAQVGVHPSIRLVATMLLLSEPTISLTRRVMHASSISTPRRRNTWMSVVLPTSSESRIIHTLLLRVHLSSHLSPTRV